MRQAKQAATLLQPGAGFGIGEGKQHQSGIGLELVHDAVKMLARADHRPEMPRDIGIVELRERRLGDHLERFAGRIRQEVEVQAGHVDKWQHKPREGTGDKHGMRFHAR